MNLPAVTVPYPVTDRQQADSYKRSAPPSVGTTGHAHSPSRGRSDTGAKLLASCAGFEPALAAGRTCRKSAECGFTLIELIMVIALSGIVAVMISTVMSRPLQGFLDQSRRAELTDLAATALNRMARDIRLAVPNSLTASGNRIHFVAIEAAGRYRANLVNHSADPPVCMQAPCTIEILSPITPVSSSDRHWLIIYNVAAAELVDDTAVSVISPKAFTWSGGVLSATLAKDFRFKYASPQRRFYLAKESVTYRCDSGRLLRSVSNNLDGSHGSEALVVDSLSGCTFSYVPASNTRNGLVTLRLSLSKEGETITLVQQVHVDNAP
ncbi:type II secretion system protein J [Stutzerimonas chloritidismutans]|uniref:PulJ/GspJ family protein n=1 Tax=Stutzerimonas chloritidismutans TaxID=203192 RepID=UPI00384B23BD